MNDLNWVFVAVLAYLQIADIISTHVILSRGGRELNPLLAWLFQYADPLIVMGVLKAVFLVMCVVADLWWLTASMCVLYGFVVVHNFKEMKATK